MKNYLKNHLKNHGKKIFLWLTFCCIVVSLGSVITANAEGFKQGTMILEFEVHDNGSITGNSVVASLPTEVVLYNKDVNEQKGLEGAVFTVTNEKGNSFDTEPSNEKGEIRLTYLIAGDYKFTAKTPSKGYQLSDEVYIFTINADGSVTGDDTILSKEAPPDEIIIFIEKISKVITFSFFIGVPVIFLIRITISKIRKKRLIRKQKKKNLN